VTVKDGTGSQTRELSGLASSASTTIPIQ